MHTVYEMDTYFLKVQMFDKTVHVKHSKGKADLKTT